MFTILVHICTRGQDITPKLDIRLYPKQQSSNDEKKKKFEDKLKSKLKLSTDIAFTLLDKA